MMRDHNFAVALWRNPVMDFSTIDEEHAYWHERLRERFGMNVHPEDIVSIAFPDMFMRPNSKGEMKPRDQGDMTDEEYAAHWDEVHDTLKRQDIERWKKALGEAQG